MRTTRPRTYIGNGRRQHMSELQGARGVCAPRALVLMVFLVMNCLCCHRLLTTKVDTSVSGCSQYVYAQLEQTQETAVDSASLKLTIDQQICPQFNMLDINDIHQEVLHKVFPARHKWYIIGIQLGMRADDCLDAINGNAY